MIGTATLPELFEAEYRRQRMPFATAATLEQYRLSLRHWGRIYPGLPVSQVTSRCVAMFQADLAATRTAATVNGYVRPLMAVLRWAAEEDRGLLAVAPKVRMLPERKRSPLALTVEEFGRILLHVDTLPGLEGGYPATDWWTAVLLTCWESGLRYSALLAVRTVDLLWDDRGLFSQAEVAKDRKAGWFPLQDATLDAIRKIYDPVREFLFPRTRVSSTIGKHFRAILDASGIYAPKGSGMAFHRLRRSKASYTELAGGDAQRALGHSARSVTERYLDPRIVGRTKQPPMPLPI